MSKKTIGDCRSGKDLLTYVKCQPNVSIRPGKGSHVNVSTPGAPRPIPIPQHNKDLPTGTLKAIIKQLAAIGIACFVIACILYAIILF